MRTFFLRSFLLAVLCTVNWAHVQAGEIYPDERPNATLRLEDKDHDIVLYHGDGPNQCGLYGAREALIFVENGVYHLFYDGAGPKGWLACLATSTDILNWDKKGPILDFG